MKLADARKAHEEYSGKASDICRQLAFAGLGIVWIFKTDVPNGVLQVPQLLVPATVALVVALCSDLLQYVWGATAWGYYHRVKEKHFNRDQSRDFAAPIWMNWPTNIFWYGKIAGVMVGFVYILLYLKSKLGW
jgi:hypothetical protein